jgi:nucleotide-binding universal stress UspA family protein
MDQLPLLVPLDGSAQAEAALPYAVVLAQATGAPITLLSVVDIELVRTLVAGHAPALQARIDASLREPVQVYLGTVAANLATRDVAVTAKVLIGDPLDEILAEAALSKSTIVIATHGHGGVQRLIVGSVADKIMRLSARPTLVVRAQETANAPQQVAFRRLMVPLDGSPLAETALPPAVELAAATDATMLLVRAEPFVATMWVPEYALGEGAKLEQPVAATADAYLAETKCRCIPAGTQANAVLLRGAPARELVDVVTRERVDLVVMTTHGRGGARRLILGSVADRLIRSGVPVLLIRPATPASGENVASRRR